MCGGSRIKSRLIESHPGPVSLVGIARRIAGSSLLILLGAALCLAQAASPAPSVTKVEPPSWWTNQQINPVRLIIRGTNLNGARVKAERPQTALSNVRVNDRGTYLFVDVRINAAATPGDYPLTIETAQGRATVPFHLNPPLDANKNFQGITSKDVIYLIMIDRFSDGDPSNNSPAGAPTPTNERPHPPAYHRGDPSGLIHYSQDFKSFGVTPPSLAPPYANWDGLPKFS